MKRERMAADKLEELSTRSLLTLSAKNSLRREHRSQPSLDELLDRNMAFRSPPKPLSAQEPIKNLVIDLHELEEASKQNRCVSQFRLLDSSLLTLVRALSLSLSV